MSDSTRHLAAVLRAIAYGEYNDMDSRSTLKLEESRAVAAVFDAIDMMLTEDSAGPLKLLWPKGK